MAVPFASPDWVDRYLGELRGTASVRTDSMTWVHGPVLFLVEPDGEHGFDATGIRIDLHEGEVRDASRVPTERAGMVPFVFAGSLDRWRTVMRGEQTLVDGVLRSRIGFRGDLPTISRHRGLLDAVARVGAAVETSWPDEVEAPSSTPVGSAN